MKFRLARYDGAYRSIFGHGAPLFDARGCFAGYVGAYLDITSWVEAEHTRAGTREAQLTNLHGLLPICARCKSVRNDEAYWQQQVHSYISEHPDADFSHAICPSCLRILYPHGALEAEFSNPVGQ